MTNGGNNLGKGTSDRSIAALIFLVALAFRCWYVHELVIPQPIRGDAIAYVQYSENLLKYGIFSKSTDTPPAPDSFWAPGFPASLALLSKLSDTFGLPHYETVLYAQAVMGALVAWLSFLTARLYLARGWALLAAGLVSFSPHLASHGGYFLSEILFTLTLLLGLYAFLAGTLHQRSRLIISAGLAFGMAYLVNPVILLVPFLLLLGLWLPQGPGTKSLRPAIYSLVLYSLIVGAWAVRSAVNVPETAQHSSDRIFVNLVIGAHRDFHQIWRKNPRDPANPATIDLENVDGSYSAFLNVLWPRIQANPGHYLNWYLLEKPLQLWSWNILTGQGDIFVYPVASSIYHTSIVARLSASIMKATHYWWFAAALIGLLILARERDPRSRFVQFSLYSVLLYVSAVYVVLQSEPRYSVPLRPEMYLSAIYAIARLSVYLQAQNRKRSEPEQLSPAP